MLTWNPRYGFHPIELVDSDFRRASFPAPPCLSLDLYRRGRREDAQLLRLAPVLEEFVRAHASSYTDCNHDVNRPVTLTGNDFFRGQR